MGSTYGHAETVSNKGKGKAQASSQSQDLEDEESNADIEDELDEEVDLAYQLEFLH